MNISLVFFLSMCFIAVANSYGLARQTPKRQTIRPINNLSVVRRCTTEQKLNERVSFSLAVSPNGDGEKSGIETKYLVALGVFLFACVYDFFVTHGGQVYLAHP